MLDIRLIGTPRVFLNGEQISVQRTRTRAILFYLAMNPQGVDRGRLAEYFGGEGDESKKRAAFRRHLNFVRGITKEFYFVVNYHDSPPCFSSILRQMILSSSAASVRIL